MPGDNASIVYSLVDSDELDLEDEDSSPLQIRMSRSTASPSTMNTFAGRLRGSQRVVFVLILGAFLLTIVWLLAHMDTSIQNSSSQAQSDLFGTNNNGNQLFVLRPDGTRKVSDIKTKLDFNYDWYEDNCYKNQLTRSISDTYKRLQLLKESKIEDCHLIWTIFNELFRIESIEAPIALPILFQAEVKGWLNNDEKLFEQVNHQVIYKVVNRGTYEESVFNPIRAKRPVSKSSSDPLEYVKNVTESTKAACDFCKYQNHTAEDIFGRIENKYSASASNAFKLAKFHGLFFPKQHDPLNITLDVLKDVFLHTSKQWFQKAYDNDNNQIFPSIMWDTLPHSGASQVHPHIHGVLDANQYVGGFESWRQISVQYYKKFKRSLWSDFIKLHFALGLGYSQGQAVILVPVNAKKDNEFMILSQNLNEDVVSLIHTVMQTYIRNLGVYCFSAGGVYPKMGATPGEDLGMPVVFRIGSRGTCNSIGSDVSSLELYTINNINSDLDKTFNALLQMAKK